MWLWFLSQCCDFCKQVLPAEFPVVYADRAGYNHQWHPACFMCSKCSEPLVDLIYFWNNGAIWCGRHYCDSIRPRCAACDEVRLLWKWVFFSWVCWTPIVRWSKQLQGVKMFIQHLSSFFPFKQDPCWVAKKKFKMCRVLLYMVINGTIFCSFLLGIFLIISEFSREHCIFILYHDAKCMYFCLNLSLKRIHFYK